MTKLLDKVLQQAARLSAAEQDRIARLVLDEIEDEARWQATFAGSQSKLAELAAHAREDIAAGAVRDEDPSNRTE
jgi:hypothetical protein